MTTRSDSTEPAASSWRWLAPRRLLGDPAFSLGTVLCLGLGVAVLTTMGAVTDAFLLRPLPFAQPDRLVAVWKTFDDEGSAGQRYFLKPTDFQVLREQAMRLHLAAVKGVDADVTGGDEPVRVPAGWSTAELATVLGLRTVLGRFFSPAEERTDSSVAVISWSWWRERWGGDSAVLGSTLIVDGRPYTVIGVLDAETSFPDAVDLWLPLRQEDWEGRLGLTAVGRLAAGATLEQARQEVFAIGRRLRELDPALNGTAGLDAEPLQDALVENLRPALLGLTIAAASFLLIALANTAALVTARAVRRRADAAVRVALGARLGVLSRQIAGELGLLVTLAAALGIGLARVSLSALLSLSPITTFAFAPVRIDGRILLAVGALVGATTVLLAAVHLAAVGGRLLITAETRGARAPRRGRLLSALVITDLAITVVMLIASWQAAHSVRQMSTVDPGLRAEQLTTAGLSASSTWAETHHQRLAFVERSLAATGALPGVESVAAVHALPMSQPEYYWSFRFPDRAEDDAEARDVVLFRTFAGDYFATLGMRVLDGRGWLATDVAGATRVVWVNQAFAARHWPDGGAVGRRLMSTRGDDPLQVVGVVSDVLERGLARPVQPCVYWPMAQYDRRYLSRMRLVIRSHLPPASLHGPLRQGLHQIDPAAVLSDLRPMSEIALESITRERFTLFLLALFAILAVVQAAAGIAGLTGYVVASRNRELGLRFALGASRRGLARLILGDGLRRATLGFGFGAAAALLLNRLLDHSWQIGLVGPATYGWVALLLLTIVLAAALPAAHRATRVDPLVTLDAEP